jgi:glycosyltransferase involved in cell wall biosynthesis
VSRLVSDFIEREPIAAAPLSIVLFAHNEGAASALDEAVSRWVSAGRALKREFEVILVDDGSSDEIRAIGEGLAARYTEMRPIHHPKPRGLGAALRTGLAAARYPLILTASGDPQFDPGDLQKLLQKIDHVDLVTGIRIWRPVPAWLGGLGLVYRLLARVVFGVSLERRGAWLGWAGLRRRWLARWAFGVRIQDAECLLRLYRRSILPRLVVQSRGPFALVEILAKANFLGCLLDEVAVMYRPRAKGGIADPGPHAHSWTDAWRVFKAPDFGPVKLSI